MATYRPLIVNAAANQIQELASGDSLTGNGIIPVGGIIMWSGTIAEISSLTGWALCNGSNGTPDLRERFVVGAGGSNTTTPVDSGQNTDGYSVGEKAGSANATLVSHYHVPNGTGSFAIANTVPPGSPTELQVTVSDPAGLGRLDDRTGSTGEPATNANLPPYYALAFIMRTL
jgi:hypothetical protein